MLDNSNYSKHLYFENTPKSKEFALDKCNKVLAMIARLKDRNKRIEDYCLNFYGRDSQGKIKATENYLLKINENLETIKRLKTYYNYCINKLEKF